MNVKGVRIGIDGFCLLFLFREEREAFRRYLTTVQACGDLTVIMDKRASKEKREVVEERKSLRKEAGAEAEALTSFTQTAEYDELDEKSQEVLDRLIIQKKRAAWCLYSEYVQWFLGMLKELGIPVIWAAQEADPVLAKGDYDIVISSDSDMLILGCRRLWLPRADAKHNEIDGVEFKSFIGLEGEQLFQLAYLAGCDVQPHSLMSVTEAVSRLRFYGSLRGIFRIHPEIVKEKDIAAYLSLKSVWTS